jgi:ribonuclease D
VYDWIDSPDALRARLQAWQARGVDRVALDTEFIRERTYYPQLALVQLAVAGVDATPEILLVDTLVPGIGDALRPLLLDPTVTKVMHSASEDLQALARGAGAVPAPLFDTQVAAAMAGYGAGLGYQKLVEAVTGEQLEKGETRSDWLRRPLSDSQKRYAAEDVVHLHELHDVLRAKLRELGREGWLVEDTERAVRNARNDVDDPHPHLALRNAERFDLPAQARLCRLLRWRDAQARVLDRPRSWLLDNDLAAILARRVPADFDEFSGLLDRHPKAPRKARGELWKIVSAPLGEEDLAIPAIRVAEAGDKQALKDLQAEVAGVAAGLALPEGLLCSRRHLERLLEGRGWPVALEGWRRELLEPALTPKLPAATQP